jgi:hypothetical protein
MIFLLNLTNVGISVVYHPAPLLNLQKELCHELEQKHVEYLKNVKIIFRGYNKKHSVHVSESESCIGYFSF